MPATVVVYAVLAYLAGLGTIAWAIGFVAGIGLPATIDGPGDGGLAGAAVDTLVLAVFAVQHSVMARPAFKRRWTRLVPPAAERSTYVLFSSLALILVFAAWQPLPATVWDLRGSVAGGALAASAVVGWVVVFASTFMIDHVELFGLAQAWRRWRDRPAPPAAFSERLLYRLVRHPLMLGFLLAFWAAPRMTRGHLLFAALTTAYIVAGTRLEERDLRAALGETYRRYAERVPMLVPFTRRPPCDGR